MWGQVIEVHFAVIVDELPVSGHWRSALLLRAYDTSLHVEIDGEVVALETKAYGRTWR